ncbi:RluA family pseudouridine synthase, partial [Burkholderia pseudomallei]
MTRSSSLNARAGKSNRDDYIPSASPADASAGDSLDDDLTSDTL